MTKNIVVVGSGFAGMWAAISAARAVSLAQQDGEVAITVVSPTPNLTIRPRLYEAELRNMNPDIAHLLMAVGVVHVAGIVETIDSAEKVLQISKTGGGHQSLAYDRLVMAAGSQLFQPDVPGLSEFGFNTDSLASAQALEVHLQGLREKPETVARNTVVIAGGGFTGIEAATEMPIRLRAALGADAMFRVVIVDTSATIGLSMGEQALPYVQEALIEAGIETRTGTRVSSVDAHGVTLSSGERIEADTLVWSAGMRASPIVAQVPGDHDALGRVVGDPFLRAPASDGIFVTGDTVLAATDDQGNFAPMSCQHAMSLGRVAGHNAAAELVGLELHPYSQPKYVTCLDLGEWGALYTEGWNRQVRFTRAESKKIKQEINQIWIYPPAADRDAVFAVANPDFVIVP
ncbi:MAG: FAD-dependent oxidoreductase [Novosphingobium sp. 17-62-19]|uniref:NAD(P)/FAD-dependent oxidoreductase n=1 Tax=Novosphingobium sp. 17-62-19 TaxID=1970406 RepID=UPI000BCB6973|nr:FAD-dependent oxidoreductase [Novosphingobium sp. 17-62-19]OZA17026.1 MAG: FAD-dependent oxidoreductase [Novosphingobium sp. 17-62-19]HQS97571.1 FAD-dependent oxidoreductase [Novosphingobium sp.]